MTDNNNVFITFEGCDGTGKTTQSKLLADDMHALLTSDPKGTVYGKQITDIAIAKADGWAQAFAFLSARAKLTEDVIMPALLTGRNVICDRFMDSTFVYQGILGGLNLSRLRDLTFIASHNIKPDLTIILRFNDLECLHERIVSRAKDEGSELDRFDAMSASSMREVQDGFMSLASAEPWRFIVIDCDNRSVNEIHEDILKQVNERLKLTNKQ